MFHYRAASIEFGAAKEKDTMRKATLGLTFLLLAGLAKLQPVQPLVVVGPSMQPTFTNYQCVLTTRSFDSLGRGDIVTFQRDGATYVKRVAYLPGDRIASYYNGVRWLIPADEKETKAMIAGNSPCRMLTVPEGHVFVIGDNVDNSVDSRDFGWIDARNVTAKVIGTYGSGGVLSTARLAHSLSVRRMSNGAWA